MVNKSEKKKSGEIDPAYMYLAVGAIIAIFAIAYLAMFFNALKENRPEVTPSIYGNNIYLVKSADGTDYYAMKNRFEDSTAFTLKMNSSRPFKDWVPVDIKLNDTLVTYSNITSLGDGLDILYKQLPIKTHCITGGLSNFIDREECPEQIDFDLKVSINADEKTWENHMKITWYQDAAKFCEATNYQGHNCNEDYPEQYCALGDNDWCADYRYKMQQKEIEKQKAEEKQEPEPQKQSQKQPTKTHTYSSGCESAYSLGAEDAREAGLDSSHYGGSSYYDYYRDKSEISSGCYDAYEEGFYDNL